MWVGVCVCVCVCFEGLFEYLQFSFICPKRVKTRTDNHMKASPRETFRTTRGDKIGHSNVLDVLSLDRFKL